MHAQKYVTPPAFVSECRTFKACDKHVRNVYEHFTSVSRNLMNDHNALTLTLKCTAALCVIHVVALVTDFFYNPQILQITPTIYSKYLY